MKSRKVWPNRNSHEKCDYENKGENKMKDKSIVINRLGASSVIKALDHETNKSLKDVPDVTEIEASELKEFLNKFYNKEENEKWKQYIK